MYGLKEHHTRPYSSHSRRTSSTGSIERLPNEVLFIIVSYVGGRDLMNLRSTCKRLLNIVDHTEKANSGLWKRFLFRDFPRPCVESVARWCYTPLPVEDSTWKKVYSSMHKVILRYHNELKYKHIVADEDAVKAIDDIKFLDDCLYVVEDRSGNTHLVGIGDLRHWSKIRHLCEEGTSTNHHVRLFTDWNSMTLTRTLLRASDSFVYRKNSCAFERERNNSTWAQMSARYEKCLRSTIYLVDEINCKWTIVNLPDGTNPVPGTSNIEYVAIGRDKALISHSCVSYGTLRVNVTALSLSSEGELRGRIEHKTIRQCRGKVVKIQMLDNFALLLCEDGVLLKCSVNLHSMDEILTIEDEPLCVGGKYMGTPNLDHLMNKVVDFVLLGQLFVAVTDRGRVYLRWMREPTAEFLENSRFAPYTLPLHPNGHITRISVDITEGITVAALEKWPDGASWVSALHVVFVDKAY